MISEDMALVQEYVQSNSEQAFAALVSKHVNLVYSVALRQVHLNPHLAEEITQGVFIVLALKAKALGPKTILSAWLCRTARYVSANTLRIQRHRHFREQESHMQSTLNETEPGIWNQIAPLLDEALSSLGEKEHDAVVLRFFDGKELKQVGAAMGTTEDAARMRVNRGLEKLRKFFAKKGITLSTAAIAGAVVANSVQAAPVGLVATVTAAALSGTTIATATLIAAIKAGTMTTIQKALITATVAMLAGAGIYEARRVAQFHNEIKTLRQQRAPLVEQIEQLQGESKDRALKLASLGEENEQLNRNSSELMRLRGEAGNLRRQLDDLRLIRNKNLQVGQALQARTAANQDSTPPRPVAKILVTHILQPQAVSEEQILAIISIKPGDIFNEQAVNRDVRNLYNTGLFYNIRVANSASDEGVTLNYVVQEKPRISRIRFAGNTKFAGTDLAKLLSSRVDESLDARTLFYDTERIKELYLKSGLSDAEVKFVSNINEDVGMGEVTFEIAE